MSRIVIVDFQGRPMVTPNYLALAWLGGLVKGPGRILVIWDLEGSGRLGEVRLGYLACSEGPYCRGL